MVKNKLNWTERISNLILEGLQPETKKFRFYKTASKKMAKREKELERSSLLDKKDTKERALAGEAKRKNSKQAKEQLEKMKEKGLVTRDRSKK